MASEDYELCRMSDMQRLTRSMALSQLLDNAIENAIRLLALDRKNYLFCGNDTPAYRVAIVYSLIGTVRIDYRIWMEDVPKKIVS